MNPADKYYEILIKSIAVLYCIEDTSHEELTKLGAREYQSMNENVSITIDALSYVAQEVGERTGEDITRDMYKFLDYVNDSNSQHE